MQGSLTLFIKDHLIEIKAERISLHNKEDVLIVNIAILETVCDQRLWVLHRGRFGFHDLWQRVDPGLKLCSVGQLINVDVVDRRQVDGVRLNDVLEGAVGLTGKLLVEASCENDDVEKRVEELRCSCPEDLAAPPVLLFDQRDSLEVRKMLDLSIGHVSIDLVDLIVLVPSHLGERVPLLLRVLPYITLVQKVISAKVALIL